MEKLPKHKLKEKLLNIKVSPKDKRALEAAARKYAGGNLSAWLRLAGSNYVPQAADVVAAG